MTSVETTVGDMLREWRQRRGLSQMELALRADVSTRHLSFLENGRSRPTRSMLLRLCERLDVPLRERNGMLLAAGLAPAYSQHALSEPSMSAASEAITDILRAHEPYPAIVIDRHWAMVDANDAVGPLIEGAATELLEPPVNVLPLSLHPDGLAPRIANLAQWRAHLLARLEHEVAASLDHGLADLLSELRSYPGDGDEQVDFGGIIVPLRGR